VPENKIINTGGYSADVLAQVAEINAEVDETPGTDADIAAARAQRAARGLPPLSPAADFEARRRHFAILLAAASPDSPVSPAQLRKATGLSESWLHLTLKALVRMGVVTKLDRARYAPFGDPDILAAIEAIRRENESLGAQARDLVEAARR
jgi:hypothetical protein